MRIETEIDLSLDDFLCEENPDEGEICQALFDRYKPFSRAKIIIGMLKDIRDEDRSIFDRLLERIKEIAPCS